MKDVMIFKMILQEPSFIDKSRKTFAEGSYLANKRFLPFVY